MLRIEDKELSDLHFYWLTRSQYNRAIDSDGYFYESIFKEEKFTQVGTGVYRWIGPATTTPNTMYYMVFSSNWHKVTFDYDVDINYVVYDMSGHTPVSCPNRKCEFTDVKKNEIFVAEYNSSSSVGYSGDRTEPESVKISLHDNKVNYVALFVCLGVFGFFTVALVVGGIVIKFHLFKKIKKLFKKVGKSVESSSSSSTSTSTSSDAKVTQMETVATPGVATPGAAPPSAMAGAPPAYPADPVYSGAPAPYPSDATAPPAAYPTQSYLSDPTAAPNPYPDGMPPTSDPTAPPAAYPGSGDPTAPVNPYPDGMPPTSDAPY